MQSAFVGLTFFLSPFENLENEIKECIKEFEGIFHPDSQRLKVVMITKDAALLKFTYELSKSDIGLEVRIRRRINRNTRADTS